MGVNSSKARKERRRSRPGAAGEADRARRNPSHIRQHQAQDTPLHLDWIRLSGLPSGYTYMWDSKTGHLRVWSSPAGDGLGAFLINAPPSIPAGVTSLVELAAHCPELHRAIKGRGIPSLVELSVVQVAGGYGALRIVTKIKLRPSGAAAYTGAFLIPFKGASIVIKVECEESGINGTHDNTTTLYNMDDTSPGADAGPVPGAGSTSSVGSGLEDEQQTISGRSPYDPPLSRVRCVLSDVQSCLVLHPCCAALAPFPMPLLRKVSEVLSGPVAATTTASIGTPISPGS